MRWLVERMDKLAPKPKRGPYKKRAKDNAPSALESPP